MLEIEIKTLFPTYYDLATASFNREHNLWDRPMYQQNPVFQSLKAKYGIGPNAVVMRNQIIDLFSKGKLYDAYLCTLVWGNIGTFQNGRHNFESAFSVPKQDVEKRIKNLIKLIATDNIEDAFNSMCIGGTNHFSGLGVSFFTKILYFIAESLSTSITVFPLIFDSNSLKVLNRIYRDQGVQENARQTKAHYLFFCNEMSRSSGNLKLPTPGYLEAFLFNDGRVLL